MADGLREVRNLSSATPHTLCNRFYGKPGARKVRRSGGPKLCGAGGRDPQD